MKLLSISILLLFLTACQTEAVTADPLPTPINRLTTTEFATAKNLFESNCQGCHVSTLLGPAFKAHLPIFSKVDNGQSYLINALLFGLEGPITAGGKNFDGIMASRANDFSDSEIALLLNYGLTGLDNDKLLADDFKLITSDDVAKERQTTKTASDVFALRNALELP